jgi:hypothetical protein
LGTTRLLLNYRIYIGLLCQLWLRRVLHAKHFLRLSEDLYHLDVDFLFPKIILAHICVEILALSSSLLHDLPLGVADRSIPGLRPLVVHILEGV